MAHPKRKISKTRRDKRRTHYKASEQQIATCSKTGESHLKYLDHLELHYHYYRGKVLIDSDEKEEA